MVPVSLLFLRLRRGGSSTLSTQLIRQIREAVLEGTLSPEDRLPSTRDLARRLGISRNTVVAAYEALATDGTIVVRPRRGPCVATIPRRSPSRSSGAPVVVPALSRGAHRLAATVPESRLDDLMMRRSRSRPFGAGLPDLELLPMRAFERCLVRRWRQISSADALHGDPRGDLSLRRAVLRHVASARGIRATVEQVFITEGSQGGIDLCCRTLLDSTCTVWTESPPPLALRAALEMSGARVILGRADERGVQVERAIRRAPRARAAFISPAYAFPSGARLSLSRRLALLEWATKTGAALIEIDYEGELRGDGAPAQSLLGLDVEGAGDCVIHIGSFSRSMFPALRLGFLIVPPALVRPFARLRAASTRTAPHLLQAALADFIEEGHWTRHMRRLKQATRRRRELVLGELRRRLPTSVAPRSPAGGAILTIELPSRAKGGTEIDDVALANAIIARGVDVLAASAGARSGSPRGLILGIGAHSDAALLRAAEVVAAMVNDALSVEHARRVPPQKPPGSRRGSAPRA
jgi:GntR family transcriptional regulator/MocR family aminotransferase